MSNRCIECGTATTGMRCRKCNGRYQRGLAARRLAGQDEEVLRLKELEGLSFRGIASLLGVSRTQARNRYRGAVRRQRAA